MPDSALPPHVVGTVVTVGTFDGVHLGHQDVLARLTARARATGLSSLLVTFDPHPLRVIRPEHAPPLLTVGHERTEVLAESVIDYVAVVPFTRELAAYEPAQFVDEVLVRRFRLRELLIGHDHGFGRGRSGDVDTLRRLGAERGIPVDVVPAVRTAAGDAISSSAIRDAVMAGDLAAAAAGLGRPYSVSGRVVRGAGRGRGLGFPTLNLEPPPPEKLLPSAGVYAVRAQTPRGTFGGMMNLGPRPTFGDPATSLEAHLFEASGDFYGLTVRVEFVARLRDTRRFESPEALVAQLADDQRAARAALAAA